MSEESGVKTKKHSYYTTLKRSKSDLGSLSTATTNSTAVASIQVSRSGLFLSQENIQGSNNDNDNTTSAALNNFDEKLLPTCNNRYLSESDEFLAYKNIGDDTEPYPGELEEEEVDDSPATPCLSSTCAVIVVNVVSGLIVSTNVIARQILLQEMPSNGDGRDDSLLGLPYENLFKPPTSSNLVLKTADSAIDSEPMHHHLAGDHESGESIPEPVKFIRDCAKLLDPRWSSLNSLAANNSPLEDDEPFPRELKLESLPWIKRKKIPSSSSPSSSSASNSSQSISLLYYENPNLTVIFTRKTGEALYFHQWIFKEHNFATYTTDNDDDNEEDDDVNELAVFLLQPAMPLPKLSEWLSQFLAPNSFQSLLEERLFPSICSMERSLYSSAALRGGESTRILLRLSRYGLINYISGGKGDSVPFLGYSPQELLSQPLMRFVQDEDVVRLCKAISRLSKAIYTHIRLKLLPKEGSGTVHVKVFLTRVQELPVLIFEPINGDEVDSLESKLQEQIRITKRESNHANYDDDDEDKVEEEIDNEESYEEMKKSKELARQERMLIKDQLNWLFIINQRLLGHSSHETVNNLFTRWHETQLYLTNSIAIEDWKAALLTIQSLILERIPRSDDGSVEDSTVLFDYQEKNILTEVLLKLCGFFLNGQVETNSLEEDGRLLKLLGLNEYIKDLYYEICPASSSTPDDSASKLNNNTAASLYVNDRTIESIWYRLIHNARSLILNESGQEIEENLRALQSWTSVVEV